MSILINIKPKWCELITSKKKAIRKWQKSIETYEDEEDKL